MKAIWSWILELCELDRDVSAEEGARELTDLGLDAAARFTSKVNFDAGKSVRDLRREQITAEQTRVARRGRVAEADFAQALGGGFVVPGHGRNVAERELGAGDVHLGRESDGESACEKEC